MKQLNCARSGCQDVFHAFLVENAEYEGTLEIPCMSLETDVPNALIPFSKAIGSHENDQWIHFYEDDSKFERLWRDCHMYSLRYNKRSATGRAFDISLQSAAVLQHSTTLFYIIANYKDKFKKLFIRTQHFC